MKSKKIRTIKTVIKSITAGMIMISFMLFCTVASLQSRLPDCFTVSEDGDAFSVFNFVKAKGQPRDTVFASNGSYVANLSIGGIIPVGKAVVNKQSGKMVALSGKPIGMKLYTEGVVVVGMTDVDGQNGTVNPAKSAGLKLGDIILSVSGVPVSSNTGVRRIIESSDGKTLSFLISRDSSSFTLSLTPVMSVSEKIYKAGIWVRDSSAGLGTLTFFDPSCNTFAGLGHAVYDVDTSVLLPVLTGELLNAEITSASKARGKDAGSLSGKIKENEIIGIINKNDSTGIYGICSSDTGNMKLIPVAHKQEVSAGKAQVLCTVSGSNPKYYDIEIKNVNYSESSLTKNMVIEITDTKLLEITGGIVQGMSGSPIVQNGKFVGAVTHVFLNDCKKGYAIFSENMLETAGSLANKGEIKDAS